MNAVASFLLAATAAGQTADRQESVDTCRQALDRSVWQYPWYDPQTDGVRSVEVAEPWWMRWEWLVDWLRSFFGAGWGWLSSMSWFEWAAWITVVVLLIVLCYLMYRVFRAKGSVGPQVASGGKASEIAEQRRRTEALPADGLRKRGDLLSEAGWHYEQGNWPEAIVYLFSHQLVRLDKSQLIRLAKGKTNRQYLRELGRRTPLGRLLEQTMVAFEQVFFGHYPIDRARFESVWLKLDEFEALIAGETA